MSQKKEQQAKQPSAKERKRADLIDARNCLDLGLQMLYAYARICPDLFENGVLAQFSVGVSDETAIDREVIKNLNKQYVKLCKSFYRLQDKYAELRGRNGTFAQFPLLLNIEGVDKVANWANDAPLDDGNTDKGGDYYTKFEISEIDYAIYELGNGVDDIPCNPATDENKFKDCEDAIKNAEALRRLYIEGEISEYWVTRGEDGINGANGITADNSRKTFINDCYELKKKINEGLEPDEFFKKAFQCEKESKMPFGYESRSGRSNSQLIGDIGMNGILRDIFFRGSSMTEVCFRSRVNRECLLRENINRKKLRELDVELAKAGAKLTERK